MVERLPSWALRTGNSTDLRPSGDGRPSAGGVLRRLAARLQERLLGGTSVSLGPTRAGYALAMALWCLAGVVLIGAETRFMGAWEDELHRADRVPAVPGQVLTVPRTGEYGLYADGPAGSALPELVGPRIALVPERKGAKPPRLIYRYDVANGVAYAVRDGEGRLRQGRIVENGKRIEAGRYALRIGTGQRPGTELLIASRPSQRIGAAAFGGSLAGGCAVAAVVLAGVTWSRRRNARRRLFGSGAGAPVRPALTVLLPSAAALAALIGVALGTTTGYGSYSLVQHFPLPPLYVVGGAPVRDVAVAALLMALVPWQLFRLARHLRSAGRAPASALACTAAVFAVPAVVLLSILTLIEPLGRWAA
ncbi:hypothetical protein ACFV6U_06700 [Streptomyces sp. NPDC059810]|uniref:hypothetical protein n=1 Tax=Streptomyces sp. NPDC059810 TaxID=3346956 RepID=UPI00366383B2